MDYLRLIHSVIFSVLKLKVFETNSNVKDNLYIECSNINAHSFITFFTDMLQQNVICFYKELFLDLPRPMTNDLWIGSFHFKSRG